MIRAIKQPERMTRVELLIEVARLRRGLEQPGNAAWCPVCEDWYLDDDYSDGCDSHDVEVYGTAADVRYANQLDSLGYHRKDTEEG